MSLNQFTRGGDALARRYEYEDSEVVAVDFGATDDVSVDTVDGVAIFVVERDGEVDQTEIDLPDGDAEAFINNGVVTIEVKKE